MIDTECQVSNLSAMSGREQFVSYVRARAICQLCQGESKLHIDDKGDSDIRFELDIHTFYSASSLKQHSVGRCVVLVGHILVPSQAVFARTL